MAFLFSLAELANLVIMTLVLGYIFKDHFAKPANENYDPIKSFSKHTGYENFWYAVAVGAPAIVLHEMGHKFVAMAFHQQAIFYASMTGLALGILLKLLNFGFIVFVPGFVSILGNASPLQHSLIAFAGPGTNLLLWLISFILLKTNSVKGKIVPYLALTKNINLFLFIFNMIPIPPFDGFSVFSGIIQTIF